MMLEARAVRSRYRKQNGRSLDEQAREKAREGVIKPANGIVSPRLSSFCLPDPDRQGF